MGVVLDSPKFIPTSEGAYRPHWTREQYYRAYEVGLFDPQPRLELIAGEIFAHMTMKPAHAVPFSYWMTHCAKRFAIMVRYVINFP